MCDPILVTLLKMRPHYSQPSRENATPSSGTSPLASYKEAHPPPGKKTENDYGNPTFLSIFGNKAEYHCLKIVKTA